MSANAVWLTWNQADGLVEFHTYIDTPAGSLDHVLATLPATPPPQDESE
jgi:hypothetical protein